MKIYESKTLIAAMEKRSKEYQSTREQFVNLKKAFQGMADLGDDLEGKGADNIKAFYRDQAGIVDDWVDLIDMQIQFLNSVSAAVEDANLFGDTFVDMEFLENQLANAYKNSKAMVSQQKKDMKAILQSIHDILPLEVFSTDTFKQHLNDANDERKDTIKAVDDLDAALKEEYAASEINQQIIVADYTALIGATGKGKSASPIHYDAKAYRASEAYQLKDDAHKNAENYIQFKKDQVEARRIAKEQEELARKQEELANRPWYEKMLDAGSTFVGEITGYYDYKRASEGVDPVTGEKLTYGQRVAAGAMGAAGYIPVVGWFGKGAKGIKGAYSMYKAEKAVTTVDKALATYRTPKTFQALKNSEKGLYGLAAANW
ncbi:ribonuclease YeeF family protein, partial [Bacillus glycinifermentans]|uniref:ribonuclease YeeF family protein n=1 Tax=Bacillus glycinifermentans TaxID=1664069 RepID=UPI002DB696A0